jgi:methylthioribose-1-phosphate isomerase
MSTLEAIKYKRGELNILDQLLLPYQTKYEAVKNVQDGHHVIKSMKVRGAPAIAIVAALSLAVDLYHSKDQLKTTAQVVDFILSKLEYLKTSRPTAVNLFEASERLQKLATSNLDKLSSSEMVEVYLKAAEDMLEKDLADNKGMQK